MNRKTINCLVDDSDEDADFKATKDSKKKIEADEIWEKPKKVSDKDTFMAEQKRKKRDWKQFMGFMKKNPEALMSIADDLVDERTFTSPLKHSKTPQVHSILNAAALTHT